MDLISLFPFYVISFYPMVLSAIQFHSIIKLYPRNCLQGFKAVSLIYILPRLNPTAGWASGMDFMALCNGFDFYNPGISRWNFVEYAFNWISTFFSSFTNICFKDHFMKNILILFEFEDHLNICWISCWHYSANNIFFFQICLNIWLRVTDLILETLITGIAIANFSVKLSCFTSD